MNESLRRVVTSKTPVEVRCKSLLLRTHGGGVPFVTVWIIDRNKRRFAAHRQANIVGLQIGIDRMPELLNRIPFVFGVRLCDARRFEDARYGHLVSERHLALFESSRDRCRGGGLRSARQGQMSFSREDPGCRIKSNPT